MLLESMLAQQTGCQPGSWNIKRNLKTICRHSQACKPPRKIKTRRPTMHQKFCARKGYRSFWLRFAEFDPPRSAKDRAEMDLMLNIVEKYSALLFRSLAGQALQRGLPFGIKISPYPWVGLNVQDPLWQYRRSIDGATSRKNKRVTNWFHGMKLHPLLNILFRSADISKGDRDQIPLMCNRCSGSRYIVDRTPRYEISTGIYLTHQRLRCDNCSPEKKSPLSLSIRKCLLRHHTIWRASTGSLSIGKLQRRGHSYPEKKW